MLAFAIISMTLALVLYSIGVWAEKIQGILKGWHLIFFIGGLIFDTLGTERMSQIAGGFNLNLHSITGLLALILMALHAIWASVVFFRNDQQALKSFHRFSVTVWVFWLVPYGLGLILAMTK